MCPTGAARIWIRALVACVTAWCILGIALALLASPAAASEKVIGVHETSTGDQIATALADLGSQGQRFNLDWQYIEPQPPQNGVHSYHFSAPDSAYAADLAHGIRPLMVLVNAPKWAWGSGVPQGSQPFGMPPGPSHYDDWAAFVKAAARRYPQALAFEVWNEPDAWPFWGRGVVPLSPAAYTDVLHRAYDSVRSVDACTPVLGGALAAYPSTVSGDHLSVDDFVGGMMRAGAASYMDAFSVHDYVTGPAPPDGSRWAVPPGWVRAALAANGVKMPIWITEAGVSTTGDGAVTPQGQAQGLTALYGWFQAQPDIDALFIHSLLDHGTSSLDRESGYALIGNGLLFSGPTPAYYALRSAIAQSPPATSATGLAFHISIPAHQHVIRSGKLRVLASCLGCCSLQAKGRLKLHLRGTGAIRYRLRSDSSSERTDRSIALTLRLRHKQKKRLRSRAHRVGKRLRAQVTVVARDADGGIERRTITATLKH